MVKSFLNLKNLNNIRKIIILNSYLRNYDFVIFCSVNKIQNFELLHLKNEIKKLNCKSFILNSRLIKIDNTVPDLMFFGSHILVILALNWKILSDLINLLNFKSFWFFFLHTNNFSTIYNFKKFKLFNQNFNSLYNLNFLIFRLIIRISLILLLFIRSMIILISFNKI